MIISDISSRRVLIAGIVRNVETTLETDIARFKEVFAGFEAIKFFLVESDSTDASLLKLEYLRSVDSNFAFTSLGSLESQFSTRTERLAHARNVYLQAFESKKEYEDIEILAVADFNDLNKLLKRQSVEEVFIDSYWSVRTANQSGPYYDIWALRHPIWSPNDCWQTLDFLRQYGKFPELALYASVNSRMVKIPRNSPPIIVDSAFGGFGIYKREAIVGKRYSGIEASTGKAVCEHVPLNQSITREGFIIEVYPHLINLYKTDHTYRFGSLRSILRIFRYLPKYLTKILKS